MSVTVAFMALYGVFFVFSGVGNVVGGRWLPHTPVAKLGFTRAGSRAIGVAELLGGVGLLMGLFHTDAGIAAALGLFLLTGGALQYHQWTEQDQVRLLPAAVTSLVMVYLAATLFIG